MISTLEQSAAAAWPALHVENHLGWQCRSAQGYTQRANSCLPLETPEKNHTARVAWAEAYYGAQNLPPVFKLPDEPAWFSLDATLGARGYTVVTPSRVMSKPVVPSQPNGTFSAAETFDQDWWSGYTAANGLAEAHRPTARALSLRVARPVVVRVAHQQKDLAWAFASLVEDRAWVFDVVVDPAYRRQGLGRVLMQGLENEVAQRGIKTLHLQVLSANVAANTMYEGLGFTEIYRYHYRRKA